MIECICKPWRGYHKQECPCQAVYEQHKRESVPTEHDVALAYMLRAAGYEQASRRHRMVGTGTFSSHVELTKGHFAAFTMVRAGVWK